MLFKKTFEKGGLYGSTLIFYFQVCYTNGTSVFTEYCKFI